MRTRLTEMLGVEHPIMLAGMGGVSYHRLVAAVSEAGGFGCMGAATMTLERMRDEMARTRELTGKPFGVDLLTALPGQVEEGVAAIIEGGASVFVAGLGVPREVIDELHRNNVLVGSMAGKVRHAVAAVETGCDFVVAQGTEAGGHTGLIGTIALVPQVVDAVGDRVPVVAAGGLFDGRGLAAALALGADGVWLGTRFIATTEAHVGPEYHQALLRLGEDGTTITRAYTGKTCRVVANEWTRYYDQHPEELKAFPEQALVAARKGANHLGTSGDGEQVDPSIEFMPAGQGAGAITEILPAAVVVDSIMAEAHAALDRLTAIRT
jgi:enoyl-[acyl-carrier protein] reductase II